MKSQPGPPMTLGNAAAAQVRLIVWFIVWPASGRARPRRHGRVLQCRDEHPGLARAACLFAVQVRGGSIWS
jgi:hypothetical protein